MTHRQSTARRARADGRGPRDLRPVTLRSSTSRSGPRARAVIQVGDTQVLCAATIEDRVPPHLRGKGTGWVTAEYSMLPRATAERTERESAKGRIGGRTHEIQRLIGRSLRGVVDLSKLGERTITVDCDVLQADGGHAHRVDHRRLRRARRGAHHLGLERPSSARSRRSPSASSNGLRLLDLDYSEDSRAEVDFNVVGTDTGTYVEVQGTAEGKPFDRAAANGAARARRRRAGTPVRGPGRGPRHRPR